MTSSLLSPSVQKISDFTHLFAWQEGHQLVLMIYKFTRDFPSSEQFTLTSQLRRAAVSITSNIAEGFSRHSFREKAQFYAMALGSVTEIQNQMRIAKDVGYLPENIFEKANEKSIHVNKLLNGLIKKTRSLIPAS